MRAAQGTFSCRLSRRSCSTLRDMDLLRTLHGYQGIPFPLFVTPFAFTTFILFVWSVVVAARGRPDRGFRAWLGLTWVTFLLPALTGLILALNGGKVASAVDIGGGRTRYGLPYDPTQEFMHLLYPGFALLTLLLLGPLLRAQLPLLSERRRLWILPVATLFLYGCAYMAGFVAVFPGSTPGE